MPTIFTQGWGTANQAYTIDFYRSTTAVAHDEACLGAVLNLSALTPLQDVLLFFMVKPNGTVGSDKVCNWFALGSVDGAVTFSGAVKATVESVDIATFSTNTPIYPNAFFGRPIACQGNSEQQYGGPFSLALLFGGVLPSHVIIGVHNRTNVALTGNNTDNKVYYQIVNTQA